MGATDGIRCSQVGLGVASASSRYMFFGNTLSCEDVKLKNVKFIPHGLVFNGLEKLKMTNDHCFTLTFWVRLPAKQPGDSVIMGNKLQSEEKKNWLLHFRRGQNFQRRQSPRCGAELQRLQREKEFCYGNL